VPSWQVIRWNWPPNLPDTKSIRLRICPMLSCCLESWPTCDAMKVSKVFPDLTASPETREVHLLSESICCARKRFSLSKQTKMYLVRVLISRLNFPSLYEMQARLISSLQHPPPTHIFSPASCRWAPHTVMNLRKSTWFQVLSYLVAAIHQRDRCCVEKELGKRQRWNREIYNDFTEHQKGN